MTTGKDVEDEEDENDETKEEKESKGKDKPEPVKIPIMLFRNETELDEDDDGEEGEKHPDEAEGGGEEQPEDLIEIEGEPQIAENPFSEGQEALSCTTATGGCVFLFFLSFILKK